MSNTQFYLTLGVPFLTLLLVYITSVISNRSAINDLRSEMRAGFDALRSEMHGSSDALRSETGALRSEMHLGFGSMNERLSRIEQRLDLLDTDVRISHEHRLSVLEARVLGSPR